MPLTEFCRMAKGKMDDFQSKTTGVSFMPDNGFAELVWEDGQVLMQGQSKDKKTPVSSNFQFFTPRIRDKDIGNSTATTSKMGKFGSMETNLTIPILLTEMGLNQDDDMVPWLNYPIEDSLEHDYCSNILPEISGVTLNEPSIHHNFSLMDKKGSINHTVRDSQNVTIHQGSIIDQGNSSKVSSSRASHLFPWTSFQGPAIAPSGVSDVINGNTRSSSQVICGDSRQGQSSSGGVSQVNLQKQDSELPCRNSNLLNFSHFSRPIAIATAENQNGDLLAMRNNDKQSVPNNNVPAELKINASNCGLQKEMGNVNSKPFVTKQVEESRAGEQSDTGQRKGAIYNDKPFNLASLPESEKRMEPIRTTSSVCSGNCAERASNDPSNNLKRKRRDAEDFECQSEDVEEESVGVKKTPSCRGGTGSKRSRAAEVHNLSERRRRDRINEKMRALQELIPNCNKVDKASMLDEAIEYLKTLQLQVQIMSMGAGLCMPPMMFTAGMQHMHAAHLRHYSHMGVGMGVGMGMVDMNGGYQGRPVNPIQGQRYPLPPIGFQGIPPGSNLQILGHSGQSVPMSFPQGSPVPMPGRSPMNPIVASNLNSTAKPIHNADDTNSSINQPSNQFEAKNKGFDQSAFAAKNDQAAVNAVASTAVITNSNDSIPSR